MDIFNSHHTQNAQETTTLGAELAALLTQNINLPRIICLYGDLGAGKTTFTQGFGTGLGITERILSPTYTLVRQHDFGVGQVLFHLDAYRGNPNFDFSEILSDKNAFVVIEWADLLPNLPKGRIDVHCRDLGNNKHSIKIENNA